METEFIETISHPCPFENTEEKLLAMVSEWYDSIKNRKTSYKSFKYADDEIYKALLYDCFSLTASHIYEEFFSLLASLNKTFWPI